MKQGELRKRLRSKRWRQRIEVEHSSIYVALRALALPLLGITTCVALPPGRVEHVKGIEVGPSLHLAKSGANDSSADPITTSLLAQPLTQLDRASDHPDPIISAFL
ncbi:hypothetical protein RB195_019751 [Necator americanus]|uniref:Uncharacterized protein n=1 Tax=Necator americanus TaxID=51031 RepID=A0ABR1CHK9_NECAM